MQASDRITVGPPDRQPPRRLRRGGKSGLHRESCRLTAGGPFSKAVHGKCHRNIPPGFGRVRVKWCGKSAPRPERFGWQGKPHEEQDQIGDKRRPVAFESRVGCMSPAVMPDLVEWLPPWSTKAQKPAYRPADPKMLHPEPVDLRHLKWIGRILQSCHCSVRIWLSANADTVSNASRPSPGLDTHESGR